MIHEMTDAAGNYLTVSAPTEHEDFCLHVANCNDEGGSYNFPETAQGLDDLSRFRDVLNSEISRRTRTT